MRNKKPSPPNHMAIQWHDYVQQEGEQSILTASLTAKASVVGRTGLMLLACGTGAWRVRSSMNAMAAKQGLGCAADIGLTSLEYTCCAGEAGFSQPLTLTSTGVTTAKLNRLERFVEEFSMSDGSLSGEDLHIRLDEIEALHGRYSTRRLAMAAALACGAFTFLLGGGPVEIALAFLGAGIGNSVRSMLTKRKYTLFLCVALSVGAACLVYAGCYRYAQDLLGIVQVRAALLALFLAFGSGFIGFLDDYIKVVKHRNLGLLAWQKLIMQFIVTGGFLVGLHMQGLLTTIIMLPFIGAVDLGWVYYPIAFFGIIFLVNAVNLTDGLDGLCSCVTFVSMLGYLLAASMLSFYHVAVLAAATAAAAAGFLVWNFYPAKVFMGDTGSMFLGGMVTALAFIMGRPELVFFFGIVYIWDAMTVVIQRVYFKLTHGKRIFRMTPIHHAFEMRGWKEVKIDFFFSLIAIIGVVLGLMYVYMA